MWYEKILIVISALWLNQLN